MFLPEWFLNAFDRITETFPVTTVENVIESEQRYRQLIETSPAPINLFDSNGQIVWGNDAVVELLGLESKSALVGRSIFEFIHPDDRDTAREELLAVVEGKRSTGPTEMKLHRDDGEIREIRVSTAPGRYDGEDIGQAVVVDETPVRELHASLRKEREFVESALNTLHDVFYVINADGTLERWNDALVEVSGYDESEFREMDVEEFFVEADAERVSESISTALADGSDVLEATVVTNHGMKIPYEFRKRRLVIDEELVGVVGIGRDISDRRARDEHLRAVDRLLQHSLRNQINVISGTARLLDERPEGHDIANVARIETACDRLLSIFEHHHHIVDLLTGTTDTRPLDLVAVFEPLLRSERDRNPSVELTWELPGSAMVSSVSEIQRALRELIENAIVHNDRADPTVDVTVEVDEPLVSIEIADNGPTIPNMERDVVTGKTPLSPTFHPEGMGLWFVHWAVEQSGGTLSFEDNDPRGNVVTIKLLTPKNDDVTRQSP